MWFVFVLIHNACTFVILPNELERDFQIISMHHLISERENWIMGYTIVSVNIHIRLTQLVFDQMVCIKNCTNWPE